MKSATNKPTKPKIISGVYCIKCKPLNKHYIGSSDNVMRRLNTHKLELNRGSHNNRRLQKDFLQYGESNFEFSILMKDIDKEMLFAYEKCFMYIYDSVVMYKGYNQMFPTTNYKLFKEAYEDLLNKGVIKH